MRAFVLATMLLASSSLCAFAQEPGKAPAGTPQTGTPAQTDQNAPPSPDQKAGREQQRTDSRQMGPDWRMRRGDGDRMDRDEREMGHRGMMHRGDNDRMCREDGEMCHGGMMRRGDGDREDRMGREDREKGHRGMMRRGDDDRMGYDRDKDRGRYQERGERGGDDADRDRSYRGYADADRPRRRVKICVEYDNGEEYCRYRQ